MIYMTEDILPIGPAKFDPIALLLSYCIKTNVIIVTCLSYLYLFTFPIYYVIYLFLQLWVGFEKKLI